MKFNYNSFSAKEFAFGTDWPGVIFDPVIFEGTGSLAVTLRLDVGITLIFHGQYYAEGCR